MSNMENMRVGHNVVTGAKSAEGTERRVIKTKEEVPHARVSRVD